MVGAAEISWQNRTVPAASDFRGVIILGLLIAWFYFAWQFFLLPPLAETTAALPPLLRFALAKGQYMPDFGMMIAGCTAFHFRRELWRDWDKHVARQTYLAAVLPLLAYLVLGLLLLEAVHLAAPGHRAVLPWQDPLIGVQFVAILSLLICAALWPVIVHWFWTCEPMVPNALTVLGLIYFGMGFQIGTHRLAWMWPANALVDFVFGVTLCSSLFRGIAFFAPIRGPALLLGWLVMLGSSILAGPALFYIGFLMVLGSAAVSERSWFLPGERALLLWSRTALGIALAQPAAFAAWLAWGGAAAISAPIAFLGLAAVTQLLAAGFFLAIAPPARRLRPVPA